MKTINDLVARAKRRKGKKAQTKFNGHNVSVTVDAKDRVTWRLLSGEQWVRMGATQLKTKIGEPERAAA